MKGFEEVKLSWGEDTFVVPANRVLMMIAMIEDALSGQSGTQAIQVLLRRDGPPYSRLAQAYGAALRYAGADVTDDEIYLAIVNGISTGEASQAVQVQQYIIGLLSIISPELGGRFSNALSPGKSNPDPVTDGDLSEQSTD